MVEGCCRGVEECCREGRPRWRDVWREQCGESGREDSPDREHPQEGGGQGAATQVRADTGDLDEEFDLDFKKQCSVM